MRRNHRRAAAWQRRRPNYPSSQLKGRPTTTEYRRVVLPDAGSVGCGAFERAEEVELVARVEWLKTYESCFAQVPDEPPRQADPEDQAVVCAVSGCAVPGRALEAYVCPSPVPLCSPRGHQSGLADGCTPHDC